MIKVDTLKKLLNVKEKDLKHLDIDQLRTLVGVFRYLTRLLDREIIKRESGEVPSK